MTTTTENIEMGCHGGGWHRRHVRAGAGLVGALTMVAGFLAPTTPPAFASGVTAMSATTTPSVPGSNCTATSSGTALSRSGWVANTNAHPATADAPANALDGNSATRFSTDEPQAAGLFFEVDLGSQQAFDELAMAVPHSPSDYARGYYIEVSDNASSWTKVASCTGTTPHEVVRFAAQTAQYVAVVLTAPSTNWWSIDELNLFEGDCSATLSGTALSRSAWVANTNAHPASADAPANALDGNPATRFSTDEPQAAGLFFEVDLGSKQAFNELVMDVPGSPSDYARGYYIEVSDNSSTWAPVASCTGTTPHEVVRFAAQTARYVAVVLTAPSTSWWSIDELNLYSAYSAAPVITSPSTWRVLTGRYNAFTVTATGSPVPALSESGALPPGLVFRANANGTATIYGTPPATAMGTYDLAVTAANGVGSAALQQLVVTLAPTATTTSISSSADPARVGQAVTFTATVSPVPSGGTMRFTSAGAVIAGCGNVAVSTATGQASCSATYASTGQRPVQASYSGYAPLGPSASRAYTELVNLPAPGYWLATASGQVYGLGAAPSLGGTATSASTGPVVGIAATPSAKGYWAVTADGAVSAFGDARSYGDLPELGKHVSDVVAIAPTTDGQGYYLVGADGGFFTFGDARFHGSLPGVGVHVKDVVGMVATPGGAGYLLVGSDGGVFTFGTTRFYGSLPGIGIHVHNIRAILPSSTGRGYILVGSDGGVFNFGSGAKFHGSLPGEGVRVADIVGIALTPDNGGYYMAGADGHVYSFGDAPSFGEPAVLAAHLPVAAIAGT